MRILVPLDGSPSSLEARDLVAGLSWPRGTLLRLITAYEAPTDWVGAGAAMPWIGDAEDALRDQLSAELEQLAAPFEHKPWDVEHRVVGGRPATAIVEHARELDADLIVLGSRGRGALASMLLGSVSAEVLDHAPCPVLIARAGNVSRLLVATDGSDASTAIPDVLAAWRIFEGMDAEVVSVSPPPDVGYELIAGMYTIAASQSAESQRDQLERHRRIAVEMADRLVGIGLRSQCRVLAGDPATEIIGAAQRWRADLIVTGSRGLRGLQRMVLGSVARNVVLHAPCSILVMRPTRKGGRGLARDRHGWRRVTGASRAG